MNTATSESYFRNLYADLCFDYGIEETEEGYQEWASDHAEANIDFWTDYWDPEEAP